MATVHALSLALLLGFCFASCACAASKIPKNRCPSRWGPTPTNAGATTVAAGSKGEYMSQASALPSDDKHQAPKKAGAKAGAVGSKGRYISPAAMAADKPCDRPGCPSRP